RGRVARQGGTSGRDRDPPETGPGGERDGPPSPLGRLGGPAPSHAASPSRSRSGPPRNPVGFVRRHGSDGRAGGPPPRDRPGSPAGTAPDCPFDRRRHHAGRVP